MKTEEKMKRGHFCTKSSKPKIFAKKAVFHAVVENKHFFLQQNIEMWWHVARIF